MALIYGFFHGGDPRKFRPDAESCSAAELDRHRRACQLWNEAEARGETPTPEECPSGWVYAEDGTPTMHVLRSNYGIGTYEWPDGDGPESDPDDPDDPDDQPFDPLDPSLPPCDGQLDLRFDCEAAIAEDRRRGFTVEEVDGDEAKVVLAEREITNGL